MRKKRAGMIKVEKDHFFRAALEIGYSGDNDTLPYDLEAGFIKDKAADLAALCLALFQAVETGAIGKPATFMNGLAIVAERLLAPSGPHGFRITTKIHPFWNLYLNGLGTPTGSPYRDRAFTTEPDRGGHISLRLWMSPICARSALSLSRPMSRASTNTSTTIASKMSSMISRPDQLWPCRSIAS
jgi:hypothetical protein